MLKAEISKKFIRDDVESKIKKQSCLYKHIEIKSYPLDNADLPALNYLFDYILERNVLLITCKNLFCTTRDGVFSCRLAKVYGYFYTKLNFL